MSGPGEISNKNKAKRKVKKVSTVGIVRPYKIECANRLALYGKHPQQLLAARVMESE